MLKSEWLCKVHDHLVRLLMIYLTNAKAITILHKSKTSKLLFAATRNSPESGQDEEQASAPPAEIASGEDGSADSATRSISGPDDSLSGQETAVAGIKSGPIFVEESVKTKVG